MTANHPLFQITNDDGRRFHVRLVRTLAVAGSGDNNPVVEFFDASSVDEEGDEDLGYFTGIRCEVGQLFTTAFEVGGSTDTLFNEELPVWNISEANINAVQQWLLDILSEKERGQLRVARPATGQDTAEPDAAEAAEISCLTPSYSASPELEKDIPQPTERELQLELQLNALLRALDQAEGLEQRWTEGNVEVRLQLLKAKHHILKALKQLKQYES